MRAVKILASRSAGLSLFALVLAISAAFFFDSGGISAAPRVTHDPITVYEEDFDNLPTSDPTIFLDAYTGAPPLSMTYTADGTWIDGPGCNGLIGSFNSGPGSTGCSSGVYNGLVGPMAQALGNASGGGDDNRVMADVTVNNGSVYPPTPAATFQTVSPVPLPSENRFLAFSVDVGVTTCSFSDDPLLRFFLVDGVTETSVNDTAINPCTDPGGTDVPGGVGGIRIGNYSTDGSILFAGDDIGIKLTNDQVGGSGNDYVVDNIRLLDASPHLDKEFAEGEYFVGDDIPLTFVITNTSELAAKEGWSFVDNLSSGLTVANEPAIESTCSNSAVTASSGSSAVQITGDLDTGQEYCEVTVNVAASTAGVFTNGPTNLTVTGIVPPEEDTPVEVLEPLANTGHNQQLLAVFSIMLVVTSATIVFRHKLIGIAKS